MMKACLQRQSMILDNLRDELGCTVTLWTIHAQAQRCCYRALDEYSPAPSAQAEGYPAARDYRGGRWAVCSRTAERP